MQRLCPIAAARKKHPQKIAISSLDEEISYADLDLLVQKLSRSLLFYDSPLIASIPTLSIQDIALFFAAWRADKGIYPLSFRLPPHAIQKRLQEINVPCITPRSLPLTTALKTECVDEELIATCIETSGSSGNIKKVCHLLKSHFISAEEAISALSLKEEDTYALNLPLFHISGISILIRAFMAGARVLLPDSKEYPHQASHLSLVPTQLFRLLKEPLLPSHLKCLLVGGAPLSKSLYQTALEKTLPVYVTYGMTETASIVSLKPPGNPLLNVGKPLPQWQLTLAPDGEILLKGPCLFSHYLGMQDQPYEEWFSTKDIGALNAKGELEIIGRKDRQFISGGENIQPEEIEKALLNIPGIHQAHVFSKHDEEFGRSSLAKVYSSLSLSKEAIFHALSLELPKFKIPQEIQLFTEPLAETKLF